MVKPRVIEHDDVFVYKKPIRRAALKSQLLQGPLIP